MASKQYFQDSHPKYLFPFSSFYGQIMASKLLWSILKPGDGRKMSVYVIVKDILKDQL